MRSVASINPQATLNYQEQRGALNETMGRVFNRLFGCWQHELGRPFSNNGRSYRVCTKCGMSRDFDLDSWKTHGHYQVGTPKTGYSRVSSLRRVSTNQKPLKSLTSIESIKHAGFAA